jgi:hypothetical protein
MKISSSVCPFLENQTRKGYGHLAEIPEPSKIASKLIFFLKDSLMLIGKRGEY